MILSVLAWGASLLLASVVTLFLSGFVHTEPTQPTMIAPGTMAPLEPTTAPALLTILAYLLPTVLCGTAFAAGLGIRSGQAWAFSLSIVVFSIVASLGGGASAIGLAFLAYCVLRMAGVIGVSPAAPPPASE